MSTPTPGTPEPFPSHATNFGAGTPTPGTPAIDQPAPAPRRGRTAALVGGILAIVAVGAGGAYAFAQAGGGGAGPESVMPANTLAFAKVDLDPSAGQKLDAIRFIRKFPAAQGVVKEDSDLRKVIFKGIQDDGQLKDVDYAKDVEPWLGQRIGFGAVPGASADAEPTPVIALAVTDEGKAEAALPKVAKAAGGECQLLEEYALCTEGSGKLDGIVSAAKKGSLADSANFTKDMGDLGEDGIASAWFDAKQLGEAAKSLTPGSVLGLSPSGVAPATSGRVAMALRFDGAHLELAGHSNGSPLSFAGTDKGTDIANLPKGTLAAVGVANAGAQLKAAWPSIETALKGAAGEQEFADGLAQAQDALGVKLPDDLYAALGSQFSVVFGGLGEGQSDFRIAAVTNGDKAVLQKLADAAGQGMGAGGLTLKSGDDRTIVSLSDGYADEVAKGTGLGDTAGFRDAVKDADSARVAGYVDIAGLVAAFKDEMGADEAKNLSGLSALGFTVSGEGNSADFSLRLTTK